jgi:hypothetical protein
MQEPIICQICNQVMDDFISLKYPQICVQCELTKENDYNFIEHGDNGLIYCSSCYSRITPDYRLQQMYRKGFGEEYLLCSPQCPQALNDF